MPFANGLLSEMFLGHGYNTYMVGKWHLSPSVTRPPPGPHDPGRWGVASSATTASSAVTQAKGYPQD